MKTTVPYLEIGQKAKLFISGKEIKIVVRLYDDSLGEQCSQCCFREAEIDSYLSGQRIVRYYYCGITINGNTNCSPNKRIDGNRVVYKKLVKRLSINPV